MDSDGRWKLVEEEGEKSQSNGDRRSTDKGDRENKGRIQNRSKASKCVSVKKIN